MNAKARLSDLAWWAAKWFVAAAIIVGALSVFGRLQRQVILMDHMIHWVQEQREALQKRGQ